jgi:hypothetical protein
VEDYYRYTVLFVAFDKEEYGSQGSHEFLRGFLVPRLFKVGHGLKSRNRGERGEKRR